MERHIKNTVRENADLFLAASEGARQTLLQEGVSDRKIRRISNSIDTDHFKPGPKDPKLLSSLGIPPNAFAIIYVGRLAKSKGVFTLLEAFREMRKSDSSFHLLLVGKDEEGVEGWVKSFHLESSVHRVGFISYQEMPRYYRLADLLVLPSLTRKRWKEQFGYVLAETMACGVPAIGSDSGAIPEVIGKRELIFKEGSVEGLRKLMEIQRRQPAEAHKKWVRARAVSLFSSKVLTEFLRNTYNELLCEAPAPHSDLLTRTY